MQLTQPKETNRQAEQPATVSHASEPPSGKEFGSIMGGGAGSRAFSASSSPSLALEPDCESRSLLILEPWSCRGTFGRVSLPLSAIFESAIVARTVPLISSIFFFFSFFIPCRQSSVVGHSGLNLNPKLRAQDCCGPARRWYQNEISLYIVMISYQ